MAKKLYRDTANKQISGVCAGFAEYLDIDVTIVRLIWILGTLCFCMGAIVYIICALEVPEKPPYNGYNQYDNYYQQY